MTGRWDFRIPLKTFAGTGITSAHVHLRVTYNNDEHLKRLDLISHISQMASSGTRHFSNSVQNLALENTREFFRNHF